MRCIDCLRLLFFRFEQLLLFLALQLSPEIFVCEHQVAYTTILIDGKVRSFGSIRVKFD